MKELDIINTFNISNSYYCLEREKNILFLKSKVNLKWKPFWIDFLSNDILRRKGDFNQELIKAVGLKKNTSLNILDTTAGLGRDSFILATCGAKITMLERNKIIYLLLQNGLERAKENDNIKNIIDNISLINQDSIEYLQNKLDNVDIIYIDPMFPQSNKSRLVKKDMQIFRDIVGDDLDSKRLLELALKQQVKKVVVKRMLKSPYINDYKPNFELKGTTTRFDIYIINK